MTVPSSPPAGGGSRRRSPTRRITVSEVERVTPRMTRVTFTGEALAGFGPPRPAAHIKLLFVDEGVAWSPEDEAAPRPPRRTYTPRRFDPDALKLEVEFVHHGEGLAATWAQQAVPGQTLYLNGPGGGYDIAPDATEIVLVADDTALPAACMILDALPASCRVVVLGEVADAAEERPLSQRDDIATTWLRRDDTGSEAGVLLERAVRGLESVGPGAHWWVACEAAAMRRIKRHLIAERGIDPARVHTRGYWKLGETAYPDHDYGKD